MRWISLWPKSATPPAATLKSGDDAHAAEARDCAIAMAAYLPPGGGIAAGGCFMQLLDLMDAAGETPVDDAEAAPVGTAVPSVHTANPGETRH